MLAICFHIPNLTWQSQVGDLGSQKLPCGCALLRKEALEHEIESETSLKICWTHMIMVALLVQVFHMVVQGNLPCFRGQRDIRNG